MGQQRQLQRLRGGLAAVLVLSVGMAAARAGSSIQGTAAAKPYPQAVELTRQAATAVLARSGRESCLRGKLTRALLGLSASCEAGGLQTPLCGIADRAVVVPTWSLPFMDATAAQLLVLIKAG